MDLPTKRCPKCGRYLPATAEYFHKDSNRRDGLRAICRTCRIIPSRREQLPEGMKRCPSCKEVKPLTIDFFSKDSSKKHGLRSVCKTCEAAKIRQWRENNPELNSIMNRASHKRRRMRNPQRMREQQKATERRHPEVVKRRQDRYNKSEHGRLVRRASFKRYMARKFKANGTHTAEDIQRQYKRQDGRCYYCGQNVGKVYHVDHVVPLSRGGSNDPDNLLS